MKEFCLKEAVTATGGEYFGDSALLEKSVCGVSIDNRHIKEGFLFVPIKGERFDGHDFIAAAFISGALCCITEKPLDTEKPYILVQSSLQAYQKLAAWYKNHFNIITIGITGSAGKTTTKEMIADVLGKKYNVLKTEGNLNNQTGVPQMLFRLEDFHQVAVIEMGTNQFGEIAALSQMVRPDHCFLTNIGEAHIEHLGSREGILKAKCEMLDYMNPGGTVFINGDDDQLAKLKDCGRRIVTFGSVAVNDYHALNVREKGLAGMQFTAIFPGGEIELALPLPGKHMVDNALAALAAGRLLEVEPDDIRAAISDFVPVGNRMRIEKKNGITVINDAYNANPASVKAALDTLQGAEGRRVAILGDMRELGDKAQKYHSEVGYYASKRADLVLCVGDLGVFFREGADTGKTPTAHFATQRELITALPKYIRKGDTVLIKASRGMELEKTAEFLLEDKQNW